MAGVGANRLLGPSLSQCGARQTDRSLQGRFGDDDTWPQCIQQLVLGHYPVTVQEQVVEQIEYSRLQGNLALAVAELAQLVV